MSTIFSENFSTQTPGTSYSGTNFVDVGTPPFASKGLVVDFGTMTGTVSATGFFERSGHGYFFGNQGLLVHNDVSSLNSLMVWAGLATTNRGFPIGYIANSVSTGVAGGFLAAPFVNSDLCMGIVLPSSLGTTGFPSNILCLSTQQVHYYNDWQFCAMENTLFPAVVGTQTFVGVTGTLAIDGVVVCSGTGTLNLLVSQLAGGTLGINQWNISSDINNCFLGEVFGYVGTLPAITAFPAPATPRSARVTQAAVESVRIAKSSARVTQGVAEVAKRFTGSGISGRMTQGVVEVILRRTPGGWVCYEA